MMPFLGFVETQLTSRLYAQSVFRFSFQFVQEIWTYNYRLICEHPPACETVALEFGVHVQCIRW